MNMITRERLTTELSNDHDHAKLDAYVKQTEEGASLTKVLQSASPVPDQADDAKNVVDDLLFKQGVFLYDSPENGIVSSTWKEVKKKPVWVQRLYSERMVNQSRKAVTGHITLMKRIRRRVSLATTYEAEEKGSAMKPWSSTEVMNSVSALEYPPSGLVFSDIRRPPTTAVRVIESKPMDKEQLIRNYGEDVEYYVGKLDYHAAPVPVKGFGSGVTYSHQQDIAGELTSELISENMAERGAEIINRLAKDAIVLMANKAKEGGTSAVPAIVDLTNLINTAQPEDEDKLLEAVLATPKRFAFDVVFATVDGAREWLSWDRTSFYAGSSQELAAVTAVGSDVYIKAPKRRIVVDVPADYGIADENALLIDSGQSALLHILEGSELETKEFINRTRMNEIIWSATMGVSEKFPSQTDPTLRPFILFKIQ